MANPAEIVFVDSEPPGPGGGGIRAYLRLALAVCREAGVEARVYTHAPEAFPGDRALPIGRRPWLPRPWRGLMYRLSYHDNALWEHARWLCDELEREHAPGRVYEFCDYQGYGYFALRSPRLRPRSVVRVHTPAYLASARPRGLREKLAAALLAYRERDCLMGRAVVALPSAAFAAERLPWLRGGVHLPNPLPPRPARPRPSGSGFRNAIRILYLGRIEARKGVLTLLAAFLKLAKEDPDISLALVGADVQPYAGKVRALLEACPPALRSRVDWQPPCPPESRDGLLAGFDVLAVPSLWENSPYVYFEGMAAGLVCVGSETGEMKEVAEATDGPSATPGDPEDWMRALAQAVRACRDPESRAALVAAQSAYLDARRDGIPGKMLELWASLAEEGGR